MIQLSTVQNLLQDFLVLSQCQYVIRFLQICGRQYDAMHEDKDKLRRGVKRRRPICELNMYEQIYIFPTA